MQRFSQPVLHEMGVLGHSHNFVHLATQPNAAAVPGLLILRPKEPLFFGSADRVMGEVLARAKTTLRELLGRWDPQGLRGANRLFWSVADAVDHLSGKPSAS